MRGPRQLTPLAAATLAGAAVALVATSGFGADGKSALSGRVAAHSAGYPLARISRRSKRSPAVGARIAVATFDGESHPVPAGASDKAHLNCPSKLPRAIGGYFDSDSPQVVLSGSVPFGTRGWGIGVTNLSATPQTFFRGIVCAR